MSLAVPLRKGAAPALASAICAQRSSKTFILQFLDSYPQTYAMASGLVPGTPVGQLFSRSSQSTTPTLQDVQENNLGGVSSGVGGYPTQLHPENSQILSIEKF